MNSSPVYYNLNGTDYDVSRLLKVNCPGVPASFLIKDYFEWSKDDFAKIRDEERLFDGVKSAFTVVSKSDIPPIYDLYIEANNSKDSKKMEKYNSEIDSLIKYLDQKLIY